MRDPYEDPTVEDAYNTRCPKCEARYEVVRPGKIQPSCSCEYIDGIMAERDQLRADMATANERAETAKVLEMQADDERTKAEAERDELRAKLDGCHGQNFVIDQERKESDRRLAIAVKALGDILSGAEAIRNEADDSVSLSNDWIIDEIRLALGEIEGEQK